MNSGIGIVGKTVYSIEYRLLHERSAFSFSSIFFVQLISTFCAILIIFFKKKYSNKEGMGGGEVDFVINCDKKGGPKEPKIA